MTAFRITGFSGIVPRRGARLLEQNQAQVAVNCRLTSGYIAPLKPPKLVYNPLVSGIKTIFRMTDGVSDFWLAWNRDVDAVKGPIAGDTTYRTYFTGDGEPRVTNIALATALTPYPAGWYVLGVFPPATKASLTATGGVSGTTVSRAFAYTFVTPWGEESQPSPATDVVIAKIDDTWTIGGATSMDVAPANTFAVTGSAWAAGIGTLTVASTFGLRVGEEIGVTGMNPAGFNTAKTPITALTGTTISYAVAVNPGAFVAGGSVARTAPHNTTGMTKRIYWTETLADGTHFRLVKEVAVATLSTTVAGGTISTAEMASADWIMPPVDMKGIRMLAGGIAIGFRGNEVLLSPPYVPYAYPTKYKQTTDFDIVGLEVVGNMAVVGTKGVPYSIAGVDPVGMVLTKIDQPWPCSSKRSMVNVGAGVEYAAPQGKVLIGPSGTDLTTKDLYTQEEWTTLLPSSFNAAQYAGRYVASYDGGTGTKQVLIIDRSEFAAVVQSNADVQVFYGDPTTGKLYAVITDKIYEWDGDTGQKMAMDWFSKEFLFPKPINLGAAKIDLSTTMSEVEIAAAQAAFDAIKLANAAILAAVGNGKGSLNARSLNAGSINGSTISPLPPMTWENLTFTLYIDGVIRFSRTVVTSKPFRLPKGYKADNAAIRLSGNVTVKSASLAGTMKELEEV